MANVRRRTGTERGQNGYSVFITSAGVASGVNIIQSLRFQTERKVRIVAGDMNPLAPGLYLADSNHLLPPINDPDYIGTLIDICKKEQVDCLIPVFSKEIELISSNLDRILKGGLKCLVPDTKVLDIVNDKAAFAVWLEKNGIPCPKALAPKHSNLPLYVKPRTGSSSKGARLVRTKEELDRTPVKDLVFQEYIEGTEYTIDFLCGSDGGLLAAVPRERIEVRDGKAIKSKTVELKAGMTLLKRITEGLGYKGPGNLQVIDGKGGLKVIELNPRFAAGGLTLSTAAGPNMPLMLLELLIEGHVRSHMGYEKDLYAIRYYADIFLREDGNALRRS